MAVAIKGFYNMCLERGKKWKLENRKTLFSREILAVQEAAVQFLFHC